MDATENRHESENIESIEISESDEDMDFDENKSDVRCTKNKSAADIYDEPKDTNYEPIDDAMKFGMNKSDVGVYTMKSDYDARRGLTRTSLMWERSRTNLWI